MRVVATSSCTLIFLLMSSEEKIVVGAPGEMSTSFFAEVYDFPSAVTEDVAGIPRN
jgi:hypothetical protein